MTVTQSNDGTWAVVHDGKVIETFPTNEAGWRWLDRHEVHPSHLTRKTADRLNAYKIDAP
jgi:hypothetical protein